MSLSLRSLKAIASTVRRSIRMKPRMEQVAELSSERIMTFCPSPERPVHHPLNRPKRPPILL
jgi:hypothetical protein